MPYEWLPPSGVETRLHLWPYRSLPKRGFVAFIGITAGLIGLPLLVLIGSPVLWGLLPFLLLTIAAIWIALQQSYKDGEILESLTLSADLITLTRHGPGSRKQEWAANPYWLRITLHPKGGPVPQYLTLKAEGREVELGAFLTETERVALRGQLALKLQDSRAPAQMPLRP